MNLQLSALGVAAFAATGAGFAVPASAGCESQPSAHYCDGPIRADGTWQRCQVAFGGPVYDAQSRLQGWKPDTSRCYRVDPAEPWPVTPAGQPRYHIDP